LALGQQRQSLHILRKALFAHDWPLSQLSMLSL
jgi:hypothetical protein